MIRFGDTKNIPGLKKLWKECFADEDAYIDAFFDAMYADHNLLLEEENGVLMGASFFLPGEIYLDGVHTGTNGQWHGIRYVYALAVYPQYRGRGIAGSLLRRAYEAYHAPLVAEPAEVGLVGGFYGPLGFAEEFYLLKKETAVPQYDVRAAGLPLETALAPIDAQEYGRIRDAHFQKHGYVRWPAEHIAFAIQEHCASGGGAYAVHRNGREDILLYYKEGRQIIVTETTLEEKEVVDLFLTGIAGPCSSLVYTAAPQQAGTVGKAVRDGAAPGAKCCLTGMSYGMPSDIPYMHGYMNLTLD